MLSTRPAGNNHIRFPLCLVRYCGRSPIVSNFGTGNRKSGGREAFSPEVVRTRRWRTAAGAGRVPLPRAYRSGPPLARAVRLVLLAEIAAFLSAKESCHRHPLSLSGLNAPPLRPRAATSALAPVVNALPTAGQHTPSPAAVRGERLRTAPRPRDHARLPPPFVTRLPEPFSTPPRPLSPPRGAPRRRSSSAAAPGGRGLALRALRRCVREAARREAVRLALGSCEEEGGGSAVPGCIKTSLPRARCWMCGWETHRQPCCM